MLRTSARPSGLVSSTSTLMARSGGNPTAVAELRAGAWRIRERWAALLGATPADVMVHDLAVNQPQPPAEPADVPGGDPVRPTQAPALEPLHLYQGERPGETPPAAGSAAGAAGSGVRAVGENRWVIPRSVAEQARGNLNELLRQARMEPHIVAGRTEGFVVRMIRPKSLLDTLGIQRGDVLVQINGMPLDSPEKALQIFQQLREAKNLSISLQRGGVPMNFEYEVD